MSHRQQIVTDGIEQTVTVESGPHAGQLVTVHWSELAPNNVLVYAVTLPDDSLTHIRATDLPTVTD